MALDIQRSQGRNKTANVSPSHPKIPNTHIFGVYLKAYL